MSDASSVEFDADVLYRPVGQAELEAVRKARFLKFPPRLPHQPFFYPVLHEEYATQIARDWNTKDANSGFAGYVLRFRVKREFLKKYEIHTVGASVHREYWIPSADMDLLNESILGTIEVLSSFSGRGSTTG